MATRARDTGDVDLLNDATLVEAALLLPYLAALIAAVVLVIVWLYRARKNLDAFPGAPTTMRAGWAIGGWFVPLANFVIPCRVMANVARVSLWRTTTPALVGVWWAAWLAGSIGDRVVSRADLAAYGRLPTDVNGREDYQAYIDYYAGAIWLALGLTALMLVAGVALIVLVLRISRAQDARIARGWPAAPVMPGAVVPTPAEPAAGQSSTVTGPEFGNPAR